MKSKKIVDKIKEYHFEFKHVTVLFIILFAFQLIVSFINKGAIRNFLDNTQEWYQKESAEEIANLTTTSIELMLESIGPKEQLQKDRTEKIIQAFDIIFSQQQLKHNIQGLYILVRYGQNVYAINDGRTLFSFLIDHSKISKNKDEAKLKVIDMYKKIESESTSNEQIQSIITDEKTFNIFVPLVLRGEYIGAVYMKNTPDFSFITNEIITNYDETSIIYLSLILLGMIAMYFISSYTVKERDETQKLLFDEHETNLKKQITYEKELIFTKRIYHTHHKAEKIMGFIKEDLRKLSPDNINDIKYRVSKYSNFISRVIYDMKWYDPPVQTIRNQMFRTNLNEVIKFIADNIFLRISSKQSAYEINLETDPDLPVVPVNEFVVWEIIEPLIQNSIDHGGESSLIITCKTKYDPNLKKSFVTIQDNGKGIANELLERNEDGIKNIFVENTTTKNTGLPNTGYGCYIAYEMTKRCGWEIDAENLDYGGCKFTLIIHN
ncbi:MAG: ATP-binding protein [Ignavibacteriaceae bacterium]|nr:ATP-binding protein [Ignavibacteriaceae bacterium]